MAHLGVKYIVAVGILGFLFTNFIACGSQMYRMSVDDDLGSAQAVANGTKGGTYLNGIHASRGWIRLPIVYRTGEDVAPEALVQIQAAMRTWEWAVGKTLFYYAGVHRGVEGDSFPDLFSSLKDRVNGDYFDSDWSKTGKPTQVLATTIWDNDREDPRVISAADIRYNSEYYIMGDSLEVLSQGGREVVDLRSLALHELGHLLGIGHIQAENDPLSVMNPALYIGEGLVTRKLSRGDIVLIQKIYGCEGASCNVDGLLAEQEAKPDVVDVDALAH
jgi:hypothetical protein